MNLVIDIGNTSSKLGIFSGNSMLKETRLTRKGQRPDRLVEAFNKLYQEYPKIDKCIISASGEEDSTLTEALEKAGIITIILDENTPLPIINDYSTPASLGRDRIAAAVGAACLYPGKNILVIDAGTAITYEYIKAGGHYLGGGISPGLSMRFRALNEYTSKLPLLGPSTKFSLPADKSEDAIISGVMTGIIHEVKGIINDFSAQFNEHKIVLTGGDTIFFEKTLKNSIFVHLNLVLTGLNRILEFNA